MNVTVAHLEALVQVARTLSFTRAADNLHITQSALSHRVAEAERQLGITVFRRTTRSVEVTKRGRAVVDIAKEVVHDIESGLDRIRDLASDLGGHVHVAALPSIAAAVLPPILADFRRNSPEIRFDLTVGHAVEVAALVDKGAVDFGITSGGAYGGSLVYDPLADDSFVCLFPPGYSLEKQHAVTWKRLSKERFIMPPSTSSLHPLTERAFDTCGSTPKDVIVGRDLATIAGLVAAGLGVTAVPSMVVPLMRFVGLIERPLIEPVTVRQIGTLRRGAQSLSPSAEALLRGCRRALA